MQGVSFKAGFPHFPWRPGWPFLRMCAQCPPPPRHCQVTMLPPFGSVSLSFLICEIKAIESPSGLQGALWVSRSPRCLGKVALVRDLWEQ